MSAQAADALMSIFGFERATLRGDDESGKTAAHGLLEVVMSDKMREEFEVWWASLDDDVNFGIIPRAIAWKGWQASRAALVVELPKEPDPRSGGGDYNWGQTKAIEACREAIHAAGVKTK